MGPRDIQLGEVNYNDPCSSIHQLQIWEKRRIIDGIAEPVMLIGEDYDVRMMNRAAWEFSAIETDSTNKLHCYQVSHRRDLPCEGSDHPCPLQMVKEVRQPITVVHEHYTIENQRRFIEIVAAPYFGEDGTFQGIIETNRDITEKKEAEHELKQYTDRLRLLSAQLVEVEDAERLRLSRELHDQVGQNLSALGINLKIICTQLTEDIDPQVLYRLDDSIKLVR
jgi:signal transduction histidine kinase